MKKTRSDSVIEGLPQNQRDALERWLCEENISYADASKRLLADFNVRLGPSALVSFFQRCQQQRMLDRIAASAKNANAVVAKLKQNPADTLEALLGMAGQIAFDKSFQSGNDLDIETIYKFTTMILTANAESAKLAIKKEQLSLNARRVKLLEDKAAMADKAKQVASSKLSPEEQQRQMKAIFGIT